MDQIAQFKEYAKQTWSNFAALEMLTASAAPRLVRHAGIAAGMRVLDVACGTGVVALTAARLGAQVVGMDLTPKLIERAKENASIMGLDVEFVEGDAERLPFGDATFDVVVSQFGHMFAPRPEVATAEMLRVLKPGGTIAFSTWPPELYVGRSFTLLAKYGPPMPPDVSPPSEWGDPNMVRQRLGAAVKNLVFARDNMPVQNLSVGHIRRHVEQNLGPVARLVETFQKQDPPKLAAFRKELEELIAIYFEDNCLRQDYLLTRATKI